MSCTTPWVNAPAGVFESGRLDGGSARTLLTALNRFARPDDGLAARQIVVTLALLVGSVALARVAPWWTYPLLALAYGALGLRLFVLQHDCGHHSLFRSRRTNDRVGTLCSFFTGIAYEPWRQEHGWHHTHQGMLHRRGIDRVNSPMTVEEARRDPAGALQRRRYISVLTVALLGFVSLQVKRKRFEGFFFNRPGFTGRCGDREASRRGLWLSNTAHALWHLAVLAWIGPAAWASVLVAGIVVGSACGALLFWVQHNFEHTHHADEGDWRFVDAGLRGSSYLALARPFAWLSADIGLHHVHHLNARVPNYRLEEARAALAPLAAVAPLTRADFARCFTHVFWDPRAARMVRHEALFG